MYLEMKESCSKTDPYVYLITFILKQVDKLVYLSVFHYWKNNKIQPLFKFINLLLCCF